MRPSGTAKFEYLDRATGVTPGKLEQVVEDPARYASRQRDAADAMANRLARACDIAMSDAVETPDAWLLAGVEIAVVEFREATPDVEVDRDRVTAT